MKIALIFLFVLFNYHLLNAQPIDENESDETDEIYIEDYCVTGPDFPGLGNIDKKLYLTRNKSFSSPKFCLFTVTAPEGHGISVDGALGQLAFDENLSEENSFYFTFNSSITESLSFSKKVFNNELNIYVLNNEELGNKSNSPFIQTSLTLSLFENQERSDSCNTIECRQSDSNPQIKELAEESSGSIDDDIQCADGFFACSSGTCIAENHFCDGKIDCEDNSDESEISCRGIEPRSLLNNTKTNALTVYSLSSGSCEKEISHQLMVVLILTISGLMTAQTTFSSNL